MKNMIIAQRTHYKQFRLNEKQGKIETHDVCVAVAMLHQLKLYEAIPRWKLSLI